MCGIIGYTGNENAVPKILEGLSALEYRGYDSAGITVFAPDSSIKTVKSKGRLALLEDKINKLEQKLTSNCGIGHTRWATHGEPSDVNSHPHGTEHVSIVHNGIIENYSEIKIFLEEKGYVFVSETDTETAAKLIDYYFCLTSDPVQAVRSAMEKLAGSYAIGAVFSGHPGKIYCTRKDNPLIVAVSDIGNFIASDIPAVLKYTNKYYRLNEGEISVISSDNVVFLANDGSVTEKELEIADWDIEAAEKGGYSHFMIKEIHEEPDAIIKTLRPRIRDGMPFFGIDDLDDEKLAEFERIHIVACGTAMHAGLVGQFAAETLARVPVNVIIASEFRYKEPIFGKKDLVIIISQSGETADTLAALRHAKQKGVYTLAVVNVAGSSIAREADGVIYTWAGPEISVASTKAYTVQIAIMYLFALRLAYACGRVDKKTVKAYVSELLETAPKIIQKALDRKNQCSEIAKKYMDNNHIFFIGRGADYALSMEAALKLKEISYIHCEAYAAGELKHGTISLITDGTPVFALANYEKLFDKMISNIKEVRARGAKVILLCGENATVPENIADDIIRIPQMSELFMPIPTATFSQLIAYYTALYLGCDVDKPRNLAKSVTVE